MSDLSGRIEALSPQQRAALITRLAARRAVMMDLAKDQDIVTGPVPLLPAQQKFFRLVDLFGLDPSHFNVASFVSADRAVDPLPLERAVEHVLRHHDALRMRFERTSAGWRQFAEPPGGTASALTCVSVPPRGHADRSRQVESAAARLQTSLDLLEGPLLRVGLFDAGSGEPSSLLLIIHHLVADAYSLSIVLSDLWLAYQQAECGEAILLPPKTTSLKAWAERLATHLESETARDESAYWLGLPWQQASPLPLDRPGEATTRPVPGEVEVWLDREETRALQAPSAGQGPDGTDLLWTALAWSVRAWSGSAALILVPLHHGRDPVFPGVNLTRTVGWLTVQPNVLLTIGEVHTLEKALASVAAQRARIPNQGVGYELLRYLCRDPEVVSRMRSHPAPHIALNYVRLPERLPDGTTPAPEDMGPISALTGTWYGGSPLVTGVTVDGRLRFTWAYSRQAHESATIQRAAGDFLDALRELIGLVTPRRPPERPADPRPTAPGRARAGGGDPGGRGRSGVSRRNTRGDAPK